MGNFLMWIGLCLAFCRASLASGVPVCWDQPNGVDGSYNVVAKLDELAKEQILALLSLANVAFLKPEFPLITSGTSSADQLMFLNISADMNSELPKPTLIQRVLEQLQPIADLPGTVVECNFRISP